MGREQDHAVKLCLNLASFQRVSPIITLTLSLLLTAVIHQLYIAQTSDTVSRY